MLMKPVKQILKYFLYKIKYRASSIGFSSSIESSSTLATNTSVGENTFIYKSVLNDHVEVRDACVVSNSSIEISTIVYSNCELKNSSVGRFSYISSNSKLHLVKVGSFCSIGSHLICGSGEHPTNFISTSPVFFSVRNQCGTSFALKSYYEELKEIIIGHDVWIGTKVFIRDGVKIGNGAIIASGAVVVKDVPDYAIVGGVPAKLIRFRFPHEIIQQLLDIQWWNWSIEKLRLAQPFFVKEDIHAFIEWVDKT